MSTILHLLRGQMSSPVNHLGGRCPHIPFFTGGQMSERGNVRLPFLYFLSFFLNTSFKKQCNQTELSKLQSHVNTPMLNTAI